MEAMRRDPPSATVLIVDDDPAMRAVIRDFLEREGHRVIEESSGEQALAVAESVRLDVVILDKEMPGMNGLDLLSSLRHGWPGVSVILVTAFGGPQVAEEARRRGAHWYLEKPFRVGKILEAIEATTRPQQPSRPC